MTRSKIMKLHKTRDKVRGAFMKNVRLLLGVAIVSLALLPALAETRTVYAEDHDGMTPIQQLTNAVASAVEGDVIELKRGTYVFPDDVYMADNGRENSYCKFRLNVTAPGITIRGEDDSNRKTWTHESEPVVIDGNGGKAIQVQLEDNKGVRIENIAFANCNGGANGADSLYGNWCDGGAIGVGRVAGGSGDRGGGHKTVISNCVFRGNSAAIGGAVGGFKNTIKVQDCFFTNNVAESMGGCLYFCYATGCDFVGNGSVGAFMYDVTDSRLVANKPKSSQIVLDVWTGTSSAVSNCIFEANEFPSDINNYIAKATRFENCHFTNNVTARSGMVNAAGAVLTNCTFHGNRMLNGGVVVNAANLLDCRITSTRGENSSAVKIDNAVYRCYVKDCYFGDNVSSQGGGAGAYMALNCSSLSAADLAEPIMTFDHCTFEANAAANGKHGGAILNGCTSLPSGVSLESLVVCSNDCRFARNAAPHACGVEGVTAMGCKFIDNRLDHGFYVLGGDAALSRLVDCDLTGGNLYKCSVDRCRVHEVTSCGAFNVGCHVTNTLVFGCVFANNKGRGVIGRYDTAAAAAVPSEFVNCTFAANSGNFFASTNIVSLVNCAFFDNTNRLGEASAVSFHDAEDNNGAITFDHCAFGPLSSVDISGVADNSQFDVNPKFVEAPPWSPSLKSPLCEAGLVQSWMDTAADLVGNPRIKAGKVDIGCYECWLRKPGLILIFK